MRKSLFAIFVFCLAFSFTSYSQDTIRPVWDGFLESAGYARPFISEMHSTISKVELGYNKSYSEFNLLEQNSRFDRPMVEMHVGFDAPLYAISLGYIGNKPNGVSLFHFL